MWKISQKLRLPRAIRLFLSLERLCRNRIYRFDKPTTTGCDPQHWHAPVKIPLYPPLKKGGVS